MDQHKSFRQVPPYDDQQLYVVVRNCPQEAEIDLTRLLEVSLNTETTHPKQYAFPVQSKTFVHYLFSEVCFNNLTTQKMSERQGVSIHVVHENKLLTVRQL